jgi:hypothetical protein
MDPNTEKRVGGVFFWSKHIFSFAFILHISQLTIKYLKLCLPLSPKQLGAKMHFHERRWQPAAGTTGGGMSDGGQGWCLRSFADGGNEPIPSNTEG